MKKARLLICTILCLMIFAASPFGAAAASDNIIAYDEVDTRLTAVAPAGAVTAATPRLETVLLSAWQSFSPSVRVTSLKITVDDFLSIYMLTANEYPELFYISSLVGYKYNIFGYVVDISLFYSCSKETYINTQKPAFDAAVQRVLGGFNSSMNDVEKMLYLHDYITLTNAYDPLAVSSDTITSVPDESFSAYGCLVKGVSVCQGISDAFKIIANKLGYECDVIISMSMQHAWNMVKIGGNYYHIDITWEEASSYNDSALVDLAGYVSHSYFLLSDVEIAKDHSGWLNGHAAESTDYSNGFWRNVNSAIYKIDGYQYYISAAGALVRRNAQTGSVQPVYNLIESEYSYANGRTVTWRPSASLLAHDYKDKYVFFSAATKIYLYDIENDIVALASNPQLAIGCIAGLGFTGSELFYDIKTGDRAYNLRHKARLELPTPNPSDTVFGDANDDGSVNAKDVLVLRKHLAAISGVTINEINADVNADGEINAKDVLLLRKYLAGWGVVLGQEEYGADKNIQAD